MTAELKGIQVNIEPDLSTVTIGGTKVEISPDGKLVTASENDGVESRAASGVSAQRGGVISEAVVSRPRAIASPISAAAARREELSRHLAGHTEADVNEVTSSFYPFG